MEVKFFVYNELKYTDNKAPYSWTWDEFVFGSHEIKVVAVDGGGNIKEKKSRVWIFNL